jgi:hypothetical protein
MHQARQLLKRFQPRARQANSVEVEMLQIRQVGNGGQFFIRLVAEVAAALQRLELPNRLPAGEVGRVWPDAEIPQRKVDKVLQTVTGDLCTVQLQRFQFGRLHQAGQVLVGQRRIHDAQVFQSWQLRQVL